MTNNNKKKIRYLKQKDTFRCGPVAVVNTLKWAGYPATYKTVLCLSTIMRTDPLKGTRRNDIDKALNIFTQILRYKKKQRPAAEHIIQHLDNGGAALVLIAYEKGDTEGHYFFIDKRDDEHFNAINLYDNVTQKDISLAGLEILLWAKRKNKGSKAWLIEKR